MSDVASMDIVIGAKIDQAENGLKKVQQELAKTAVAASKVDSAFDKNVKSSNSATFALTNLGRVAQDLPFGFLGIANNLNPLSESFQRLQKETGSTKAALAAMAKDLIGGGGLGFALSIVTAAITFAQIGFSMWSRGAGNAKKSAKDLTKELRNVSQSITESSASVQGDISTVTALAKVLEDTNKSYTERKNALTDLQKINKSYFGDLSLEKSSYEQIQGAVEGYTKALVQQAIVKGLSDDISQLAKSLFDAKNKYTEAADAVTKKRKELESTQLSSLAAAAPGQTIVDSKIRQLHSLEGDLNKAAGAVGDLNKKFNDISAELQKQIGEQLKLKPLTTDTGTKDKVDRIAEVLKNLKIAIDELKNDPLTLDLDKPLKEIDLIDNAIKRLRELGAKDEIIIKLRAEISDLALPAVGGQLEKKFGNLKNFELPDIDEPLRIVITKVEISNTIEDIQKKIDKDEKISRLKQSGITVFTTQHIKTSVDNLNDNEIDDNFSRLQDNIKNTADLLNQTLTPAFDSAFNAIANGKNVFQAVGDSIKQLVVKMIAAAAEAAVISLIVNAIFPGSGKTLSFGSIFSQISGLPKFTGLATGGIVPGGFPNDTFPALLSSGEAVIPLDKIRDFIQPQGSTQVFIPSLRVRGNDQVISFERAQNKRGRTY